MKRSLPLLTLLTAVLCVATACASSGPVASPEVAAAAQADAVERCLAEDVCPYRSARPPSPCQPLQDPNMLTVEVRVGESLDPVWDRALHTLRVMGFQIQAFNPSAKGVQAAPRFWWPFDMESEDWHVGDNPGVVVRVEAQSLSADSTEIQVSARGVCRVRSPKSNEPNDAPGKLLATTTVLMISNHIVDGIHTDARN